MAKDPAFLFYPNDYIGGTMGMTFEEKGAYMELLMMQFNRGHMTSHMIGQTVGQLWDKIQDKFIKDENGLWYNKRLEEEQIKRKAYSDSRRNNITGKNQHSKKDGHMTPHMENENEDIDILNIKCEKFKKLLIPFKDKYHKDTLNEFYKYWTEPNKSRTQIRYDLQRTWDTARRLQTWSKNEGGFNGKNTETDPRTNYKKIERI